MLRRFGSYVASSISVSKGSGFPCKVWGYRRSGRCREPWSERMCVDNSAIVAFGQSIDIAFCSLLLLLLLSSSLPVSCVSLAVFTIVRMRSAAGNESRCTVSADGAQPLRGCCGHSGTVRQPRCPGSLKSSKTTQHQVRSGHNTDHT